MKTYYSLLTRLHASPAYRREQTGNKFSVPTVIGRRFEKWANNRFAQTPPYRRQV